MKKRWEFLNKSEVRSQESLVETLLKNRNITDRESFFNPPNPSDLVTQLPSYLPDLDQEQLQKATERIKIAIEKREKIIVWGDYDVDGICATAVLWQTLYGLGAKVLPHIPDRFEEGYGLGSEKIREQAKEGCGLIFSVDPGITPVEEAE